MNKLLLTLFLAFNLYSALSQSQMGNFADQYAKDFISKYTGGFMTSNTNSNSTATNSSSSTGGNSYFTPGSYGGNPSDTKNTANTANTPNPGSPSKPAEQVQPKKNTPVNPAAVASALAEITCSKAIELTNQAIDQFAKAAVIAKDQWSVYSYAQKVNGMSEYLNNGCDLASLKILNLGKVGVNRTQDKACNKLIEFIKPILKPVPAGVSPLVYLDNIGLSQQGFGLKKYLGGNCQAIVVEGSEIDSITSENGDGVVIQTVDKNGFTESIYKIKADPATGKVPGAQAAHPHLRTLAGTVEEKVSLTNFLQEKLIGLRTIMW